MDGFHDMIICFTPSFFSQEGNVMTIQYRDLMSNFEQVLSHTAKDYHEKYNANFPITLGINAFRGFPG